jgi:hypothetical protein
MSTLQLNWSFLHYETKSKNFTRCFDCFYSFQLF